MNVDKSSFEMSDNSIEDLASILTEYAQLQRVVRNHDNAERAEVLRNRLYSQHADKL